MPYGLSHPHLHPVSPLTPPPRRDLNLRQYLTEDPEDGRVLYDLYGVINHHGGILGGHYTAAARCVDPLRPERSDHGTNGGSRASSNMLTAGAAAPQ